MPVRRLGLSPLVLVSRALRARSTARVQPALNNHSEDVMIEWAKAALEELRYLSIEIEGYDLEVNNRDKQLVRNLARAACAGV